MDNKIRVLIDVVKDNASKNLSSLKSDFAAADGASQKFKVGTSGAMDFVKANAAAFSVAAGSALVGFGAKAVLAFQGSALEAGKFSDATGLAVEDASRWIEVGGDVGVSAEAMQGAFQKLNKSIADGKLDEFSSQIARAKDGTVDANATFINIATTIGKIADPTERAQAAQTAFGKSYGEIAELMEMDAKDLTKALGDVSDAKVIDESEVAKAKKLREQLDTLKDTGEDLFLTLGEALIPVVIELGDKVVAVAEPIADLIGWLGEAGDAAKESGEDAEGGANFWQSAWGRITDTSKNGFDFTFSGFKKMGDAYNSLFGDGGSSAVQWSDATSASMAGSAFEARLAATAINKVGEETDKTRREVAKLKTGIDILNGALSKDDARQSFIDAQTEMVFLTAEQARVNGDAESSDWDRLAANKAVEDGLKKSIEATTNYIDTLGGIPASKATAIAALIDEGSYAEAQRRLTILARNISVSVGIEARGGAGYGPGGPRASGGPVAGGRLYEVGEGGKPELLDAGGRTYLIPGNQGGMVRPAVNGGGMAAGGGSTVVVNISALDASSFGPALIQRLVNEIVRVQQRTGQVWQRAS